MTLIDENMAEQASLDWFEELGYARVFGMLHIPNTDALIEETT